LRLSLVRDSFFNLLPLHAKRAVREHVVELHPGVAIVVEAVAAFDVIGVLALDHHVRLAVEAFDVAGDVGGNMARVVLEPVEAEPARVVEGDSSDAVSAFWDWGRAMLLGQMSSACKRMKSQFSVFQRCTGHGSKAVTVPGIKHVTGHSIPF
jgi:hypothetical protein